MFRIGEFAHLSGISAKALRNYDVRGIFHPAWVDPQTGYRYYSPAQLPHLRRVLALRDLGLPLGQVARLVEDGADLRTVLHRRRAELETERSRIDAKLVALGIRVESDGSGPDVVMRRVPAQRVAVLAIGDGADVEQRFNLLEAVVRDSGARAALPPGMLIDRADRSTAEIFVPVTRGVNEGEVTSRRLPAGFMATVIHRGPYQELRSATTGLEAWVEATGRSADGPMRILYLQFGADPELDVPAAYLVDHPDDYVTEIQIPAAE